MLHSLHNLLYVSFDQGGLISVDKPPLGLWLQVASAKVLGFKPISLLLPEAICGLVAVLAMYAMLRRRVGGFTALGAALALAVFPSFVAVSRDNGVDPLLLVLLVLACCGRAAGLRHGQPGGHCSFRRCSSGWPSTPRRSPPTWSSRGSSRATSCAPPPRCGRRIAGMALAGVVMVAVSFSWILYVDSVAAAKRPWVGSTTDNSELGLTFNYNGLGRVEGQTGGPGQVPAKPGRICAGARTCHAGGGLGHPPLAATLSLKGAAPETATRAGSDRRARTAADPVRQVARAAAPVQGRPRRPGGLVPALRAGGPAGLRPAAGPGAAGARARLPRGPPYGAARPPPGGAAGAGRLVRGRGGRAERLQGDRAPLLRLRAGPGGRRDGRRRGVRVREARRRPPADPRDPAGAAGDRRDDRGADRAHAPAALHGVVHPLPDRRGRAQLGGARPLQAAGGTGRDGRLPGDAGDPRRLCQHELAGPGRGDLPGGRARATTPAKASTASHRARRGRRSADQVRRAHTVPAPAGRC